VADFAVVAALPPREGELRFDGTDCVECGRCCHHGPQTVHLLEADELRMGEALLEQYTELQSKPPGFRFIKNPGDACAGLDRSEKGKFPCVIYEHRPEDCRIVDVGSPVCLQARALGRLGDSVQYQRLPVLRS
jgi:uncharacterized protein